jgi:hypothetical protein
MRGNEIAQNQLCRGRCLATADGQLHRRTGRRDAQRPTCIGERQLARPKAVEADDRVTHRQAGLPGGTANAM